MSDRVEPAGRHRASAVERAAVLPLFVASGTVAAAALTAIILSGQDPSGDGSAELPSADEPSESSPWSPAVPGADGAAAALDGPFSLSGGGLGDSWSALFRQTGGALVALCNATTAGTPLPTATASGWSASPVVQPLSQPRSTSAEAVQPSSQPGPGAPSPAQRQAQGSAPAPAAPQPSRTSGPASDPGGSLDAGGPVIVQVPGPVTRPTDPVTEQAARVTQPVTQPVTEQAARVTQPVTEQAARVTRPVATAVAPVPEQVAKPVAPVTPKLPGPADIPSRDGVRSLPLQPGG